MKKVAFLLVSVAILLLPKNGQANDSFIQTFQNLERLSHDALELVRLYRYDEANRAVIQVEEKLKSHLESGFFIDLDDWRILQMVLLDARHSLEQEELPHFEKELAATRLHLALDALITEHEPLWAQMEERVLTAFHSLKGAAIEGDSIRFRNQFQSFLSLYNMIYPSLLIDLPREDVQRMDGKINHLSNHLNLFLSSEEKQEILEGIETDLEGIFEGAKEDEADPSLWWVIISTGGIILISLIYTGWKKYKGEREREREVGNNHKN